MIMKKRIIVNFILKNKEKKFIGRRERTYFFWPIENKKVQTPILLNFFFGWVAGRREGRSPINLPKIKIKKNFLFCQLKSQNFYK